MKRRTAQAEADLIDLWLYIAQDNPGAADRLWMRSRKNVSSWLTTAAGASTAGHRCGLPVFACRQLSYPLPPHPDGIEVVRW